MVIMRTMTIEHNDDTIGMCLYPKRVMMMTIEGDDDNYNCGQLRMIMMMMMTIGTYLYPKRVMMMMVMTS